MKLVFKNTSIGPLLTLHNAATSLPLTLHLQSLAPQAMYLAAYRRMYRLRHFVNRSESSIANYRNVLRRRFTKTNFNIRRSKVLGIDQPLTHDEMAGRLANTIAFIFNSTCNISDTVPDVQFYEDLKSASKIRIETSVVATILLMENEKPPALKYDYSYKWVDETRRFYGELEKHSTSKKELNRLYNTGKANFAGFLQHETTVMGLNETQGLLL